MSEAELHVWSFGPDTVIASDEADVLAIMRETTLDNDLDEYEGETPTMMADDKPLAIYDDDSGKTTTKMAREWVESWGRGWLCSEDY